MRLRGRHYRTGQLLDVGCSEGRITSLEPATTARADHEAGWIAPAFFDLQINGCLGRGFASPELALADVDTIVRQCHVHGIAGLCPTLITGSFETLKHGFTILRQACEQNREVDRTLPCFHLEGPYISPEDGPRGAHPREHVRAPQLDEFRRWQEAAGGRIRLVTLAPEHEQALSFIETLSREGIVVALGHTGATAARIREAVDAGAKLSTHLGNGSHALLPRHDNYLWEQLACDDLMASFIPDGHHLPAAVLRCLIRCKTASRLIVTCDASSLAGLPPGRYRTWEQELEVLPEGKVVVPNTPFLAGSGRFTDDCVGKVIELGEVSVAEAVEMASQHPRKLLGLPEVDLKVGSAADLILYDLGRAGEFLLRCSIIGGRQAA